MKKLSVAFVMFLFLSLNVFAQNVGIGTTTPVAKLHVADSSVLFSGPTTLPATAGLPPVSGAGNRLMWYSRKAAFRVGGTTNNSWDETYIGKYSTAFGLSNRAAGMYATSMGYANSSSGIASFANGYSNTATGTYSAAFGEQVDAQSYASMVIGKYNLQAGNSTSWVNSDPLFVVGNGYTYSIFGTEFIQRRNAFSIDKTGNTVVNGKMDIAAEVNVGGRMNIAGEATFDSSAYIGENLEVTGATKIGGLLKLSQKVIYLTECGSNLITVGNSSLIIIGASPCPAIYLHDITLSDGLEFGQLLIIVANSNRIQFHDDQSRNMDLHSTYTLSNGSNITLMWKGNIWIQISVAELNL